MKGTLIALVVSLLALMVSASAAVALGGLLWILVVINVGLSLFNIAELIGLLRDRRRGITPLRWDRRRYRGEP